MTPMHAFQISFITLIVALIGSLTYAFAAENAGLPATAGDGASAVSGYSVTNVAYSLNSADPGRLDAVAFTLDASARTVRIKLVDGGSTWYGCNSLGENLWSCDTPGATTASIDQLRVAASSN